MSTLQPKDDHAAPARFQAGFLRSGTGTGTIGIVAELPARRSAPPELSPRQLRRIVYG